MIAPSWTQGGDSGDFLTSSQRPLISRIELCYEIYKINDFLR